MRAPSLLEQVGQLLVRTYEMRPGIKNWDRFLIGDAGLKQYASRHAVEVPRGSVLPREVGSVFGDGARLLVREIHGEVRAALYLPDRLVARLEAHPPQRGLHDGNVQAFSVFVEELDHLLLLAERQRQHRSTSLFELELHAEISKYLVLLRYMAGAGVPIGERERVWLRYHLFEGREYCDPHPETRERYEQAARWAMRFIERLNEHDAKRRIRLLRTFHHLDGPSKVELIESLAA